MSDDEMNIDEGSCSILFNLCGGLTSINTHEPQQALTQAMCAGGEGVSKIQVRLRGPRVSTKQQDE